MRANIAHNLARGRLQRTSSSAEPAGELSRSFGYDSPVASDFELLDQQFEPHLIGDRTASTAMLAWFLENAWREEEDNVESSLCDGSNDKGIDAILVDPDAREISVFQAKRRQTETPTQGDTDLQRFRGVAPYFRGPDGIDDLLAAAPNRELRLLVERLRLRELLSDQDPAWSINFVFVTNAKLDASADSYLRTTRDELPPIAVWDRDQLVPIARRTQRPGLLEVEFSLTPKSDVLLETLEGDVKMAVGLVPANELVRLPGIDDLTLFALNVRLGLGRTKINRELAGTIKEETTDHALFPAYHNGITILTGKLEVDEDGLQLDGITVVNGCQSLLALHANRDSLTPELALLVKAVQLDESTDLADTITYRSNNQNAVNIRDQRANDPIQRDLQRQVTETYQDRLFFAIRRGEQSPDGVEVLENQDAAQLIMAMWLNEPWAAVRKLKLFDEEYRRIFGRGIDSHKLYLAHRLGQMVNGKREDLRDSLSTSFASVRFTILYLTALVTRESELGEEFFAEPGRWLPEEEASVMAKLEELMDHVITEVNNYAQAREEAYEADDTTPQFDPKVAFKSRGSIRLIEQPTMSLTRGLARRLDDFLFEVPAAR